MARVRVGISGWSYDGWRGRFYPDGLPRRRELEYAAARLSSAEVNGSFYSLQRPSTYRRWREETPDDFVFAVKGSRFITHMRRLAGTETALANFLASGVLALGPKLGPLLWQLPPTLPFDADLLGPFLASLPRTTGEAARLAAAHDHRLDGRAHTETESDVPLRHALEVRHPSHRDPRLVRLLRDEDVCLVVSDAAGEWPEIEDVTSDFVYVRLHGADELYASGYTAPALDGWAEKVRTWSRGEAPAGERTVDPAGRRRPRGRDVYVYFDNDAKVHAPFDALALAERLAAGHAIPPGG